MRRKISDKMRDEIVTQYFALGKSQWQIADDIGVSRPTVVRTLQIFNAVKAQDWGRVENLYTRSATGIGILTWVQSRAGVIIPKNVYDRCVEMQYHLHRAGRPQIDDGKQPAHAPEPIPEPEPAPEPVYEPQDVNALVLCEKLIKAQEAVLAKLDDILDGLKVLASDIKDNNNVNTDLVCQKLNQTTELLNGIKANTRKKGL